MRGARSLDRKQVQDVYEDDDDADADESAGSAFQRIPEVVSNDVKTQLVKRDEMQIERMEILHCVRGEHLASRRYMAEDLERNQNKMLTACTESANKKITQLQRDQSRAFHDVSKFPQ